MYFVVPPLGQNYQHVFAPINPDISLTKINPSTVKLRREASLHHTPPSSAPKNWIFFEYFFCTHVPQLIVEFLEPCEIFKHLDGTSEMDHGWNPCIKTGLYEYFLCKLSTYAWMLTSSKYFCLFISKHSRLTISDFEVGERLYIDIFEYRL